MPDLVSTRRGFLRGSVLLAAGASLAPFAKFLESGVGTANAAGLSTDVVDQTLDAVLAFMVPGSDPYSVAQGVFTTEPGGVEAGVTGAFRATLDWLVPTPSGVPALSFQVAGLLNSVSMTYFGGRPFAELLWAQKAGLFTLLEANLMFTGLVNALLTFAAAASYSEAGVFDPVTRRLDDRPVGWDLTGYDGTARGWNEFKGYYQNRKTV